MRGARGFKKYIDMPVTVYYETADTGHQEYMGGMLIKIDDDELLLKYFDNLCWEWKYCSLNLHTFVINKILVSAKFMDENEELLPR